MLSRAGHVLGQLTELTKIKSFTISYGLKFGGKVLVRFYKSMFFFLSVQCEKERKRILTIKSVGDIWSEVEA